MKLISFIISILPISPLLRGKILRLFFYDDIGKGFAFGCFSYIDSSRLRVGNYVSIGNCVRIKYLDSFTIGNNSSIGSNTIICGAFEKLKFKERNLSIGDNCKILSSHYFDVVAPIKIGNRVVIAGKWTQLYTHSFDLNGDRLDGPISIGDDVYIGAGCIVNLGVEITSNVVIQGGTCVNNSLVDSGVYASNVLIKKGEVREYKNLFNGASNSSLSDINNAFYRDFK